MTFTLIFIYIEGVFSYFSSIWLLLSRFQGFNTARYSVKKRRSVPPPRKSQPPRRFAKRKQWSEEQTVAAMKAVQDGTALPINRAARDHGIPPTTLKDRLSGRVVHGRNCGPQPYLNVEDEKKLESFLVESCKSG